MSGPVFIDLSGKKKMVVIHPLTVSGSQHRQSDKKYNTHVGVLSNIYMSQS